MTRSLRVSLALALVAVLGWIAWQAWPRGEPLYQGKPLSFWLRGFDLNVNDANKPSINETVRAVREAGTNAIPALLRMLRTTDSDLKHKLARLAQKQRLVRVHYVTADSQRWAAREGFVALGLYAKCAIPELVEISQEEISRADWNKYATEILDLLKQMWYKDVNEDIAKALKKSGRRTAAEAGVK